MNSKQIIKVWSQVLEKATVGKTVAQQQAIVDKLKQILARKKKQNLLPMIVRDAVASAEKKTKLEIILAHEQPAQTVEKLAKKFAQELDNKKTVSVSVDPNLIGGFIAKTNEYLVDVSIKNRLEQLRHSYE